MAVINSTATRVSTVKLWLTLASGTHALLKLVYRGCSCPEQQEYFVHCLGVETGETKSAADDAIVVINQWELIEMSGI